MRTRAWWPLALSLGGCAHHLCVPVGSAFQPTFERTPCPDGWTLDGVSCGVLHTAAMPDDPGACRVDVAVADLAATASDAGDVPTVLLPGGPGQVVLHDLERFAPVLAPWRDAGPVWVIDPRGGGASGPSLDCGDPATQRAVAKAKPSDLNSWLAVCATSLRAQGIDLDAFRSDALADDVAVLAQVRGVLSVNVVGGSYGTRWGQTLLRRHPELVRSVILDSPAPWSVPLYELGATRFLDVLTLVFADCAEDGACDALLPDPWTTLWTTQQAWDREPFVAQVDGQAVPLDGDAFITLVFDAAKSSASLPTVPAVIAAAAAGDAPLIEGLMGQRTPQGVVPMLHHAITCADAFPGSNAQAAAASSDPRLPMLDAYAAQAPTCSLLDITPSSEEARRVPVVSAPALVLAGVFDPMLGPEQADVLVQGWANAQVWKDPSAAHGVLRSTCGGEIARSFLRDPTNWTPPTCMEEASIDWVTDLASWLDARP